RVFDPDGTGRVIGPTEFQPEHYVVLVEWRLAAIEGLRGVELEDEGFEWARREYRESRQQYEAMIPRFAADPEASELFLPRTTGGVVLPTTCEGIVNQACVDLLTFIGIYLRQVVLQGANSS